MNQVISCLCERSVLSYGSICLSVLDLFNSTTCCPLGLFTFLNTHTCSVVPVTSFWAFIFLPSICEFFIKSNFDNCNKVNDPDAEETQVADDSALRESDRWSCCPVYLLLPLHWSVDLALTLSSGLYKYRLHRGMEVGGNDFAEGG